MKTFFNLFLSIIILFSVSCTSSKIASKGADDDIYYSSKDPKPQKIQEPVAEAQQPNAVADNTTNDPKYKERDFAYDDYYDYEYAARLKRFHSPSPAYGYYDDYYTNSYWYNQNPSYAGVSIYLGYNWWGPTYNMYSYNPGYFWGCDPYWNRPWWAGNYGYGYGSAYAYGYQQGYMNGYNQGYLDNYYFNSYDNNSYHYGPRRSAPTNTKRATASNEPLGQIYQKEVGVSEPSRSYEGRTNTSSMNPTYISNNRPAATGSEPATQPVRNRDVISSQPVRDVRENVINPNTEPGVPVNRDVNRPSRNYQIESAPGKPEPRPERGNGYPAVQPTYNPAPSPAPRNNNPSPRNNSNSPRRK